MKPDFALKLSHEAIGLLARRPDGWAPIGEVLLSDPGLDAGLARLRDLAAETAGGPFHTKLILPEGEVLFEEVAAPGPTDAERAAQVETALQGLTAYDLDQLAYDWEPAADGRAHVVLAARFILEEAEGFAHAHQFNPVSIVSPTAGPFTREPFLGVTVVARDLLPDGAEVEPEAEPMRILQGSPAGSPPDPAVPSAMAVETPESAPEASATQALDPAQRPRDAAEATGKPASATETDAPAPAGPAKSGDETAPENAPASDADPEAATGAKAVAEAPGPEATAINATQAAADPDTGEARAPIETVDEPSADKDAAPDAAAGPRGEPASEPDAAPKPPADQEPDSGSEEGSEEGPRRISRTPDMTESPVGPPPTEPVPTIPRTTPLPEKLAAVLEKSSSPTLAAPRKGAAMPAKLAAATLAAKAGGNAARKPAAAPLRADPRGGPATAQVPQTPDPKPDVPVAPPEAESGLGTKILGGFVSRTRRTAPPAEGLGTSDGPIVDPAATERLKRVFDNLPPTQELSGQPVDVPIAPPVFATRRAAPLETPPPASRIAPPAPKPDAPKPKSRPVEKAEPAPRPAAESVAQDPGVQTLAAVRPADKSATEPVSTPQAGGAGALAPLTQGLTRSLGGLGARLKALPRSMRALSVSRKKPTGDPAALAEALAAPVPTPAAQPASADANQNNKPGVGKAVPWTPPATPGPAKKGKTAKGKGLGAGAALTGAGAAGADTSRQAPPRPRQPLATEGAVSEAEALTIFGARRAAATPATAGRGIGLVLTGALVLVLAAVALWSVFYLRDDPAGLSTTDAPAAQPDDSAGITTPEALTPAPTAPDIGGFDLQEGLGALQPAPDPAQVGPFNIDEPITESPGAAGVPGLGAPDGDRAAEADPLPPAAPEAAPLDEASERLAEDATEESFDDAVAAAIADALGGSPETIATDDAPDAPGAEIDTAAAERPESAEIEAAAPDMPAEAEDEATAAEPPAEDTAPAPDLSPEALIAAYPETGIWPFAPDPATAPVSRRIDDLLRTRPDPARDGAAFAPLPEASAELRDPIPRAPGAPPAFEDLAALLPGALTPATPDGAASPEGVLITAGSPPVVPPLRAEVLPVVPVFGAGLPAIPDDARPAPRPANLVPPTQDAPDAPEATGDQGSLTVPDGADTTVQQATVEGGAGAETSAAAAATLPQAASLDDAEAGAESAGPSETAGRAAGPGAIALAALAPAPRPGGIAAPAPQSEAEQGAVVPGLLPQPRPATLAAAVAAATPEPEAADTFATATALAVARSLEPNRRPAGFAELAAQRRAAAAAAAPAPTQAAAPASAAPSIPTRASVAQQATETRAINLRDVNLIGVFGTASNRRALVRMSGGSIVTVRVGDRLDGGQVAAIGDGELRYVKNGRNEVLRIGG